MLLATSALSVQGSLSNERLFLDTRVLFLITLRPTPFIPLSIERYELIGKLESVRHPTHSTFLLVLTPKSISAGTFNFFSCHESQAAVWERRLDRFVKDHFQSHDTLSEDEERQWIPWASW